jgi:outer membrane protein assembly factor BamB
LWEGLAFLYITDDPRKNAKGISPNVSNAFIISVLRVLPRLPRYCFCFQFPGYGWSHSTYNGAVRSDDRDGLPKPSGTNPMIRRFAVTMLMGTLLSAGATIYCQDWNQWRGPNRDGAAAGFSSPKSWPDKLKPVWKVTVGEGHASPVVAGGKACLHYRQTEREVVSCFDLPSGKLLWQDSYDAPYTMSPVAVAHGKGPKSTPVLAEGRLYTFGITEILSCYDLAKGKLIWRRDFSDDFPKSSPDFGTAMSPILDRGLLIVHAGTSGKGSLAALDAATGALKWRWTGDGPSYASPIIVEIGATRQLVTQSQQNIISVSVENGQLLWTLPFTTPYVQNIVTPVLYRDLLIFSGLDQGVFALRPARKEGEWRTERVWENKDVSMYMNSPVLRDNLLFGMSHKNKGQYFCLDAATGKTLWTGEGRQGENAAMVLAGGMVLSLNNDADLIVSQASGKAFEILRKYHVADSPTWAHPVLAGHRVLIKDFATLSLLAIE